MPPCARCEQGPELPADLLQPQIILLLAAPTSQITGSGVHSACGSEDTRLM